MEPSLDGNVLFVCESNKVISPFAEAVFNKLSDDRKAFSAGINAESGGMADFDAIRTAMLYGIDISSHETVNISDFEIGMVDVVITSTTQLKNHLKAVFPDLDIFTIMEYEGFGYADIHEPIFGDYESCFRRIKAVVSKLVFDGLDKPVFTGVCEIQTPKESDESDIEEPAVHFAKDYEELVKLIENGAEEIQLDGDIMPKRNGMSLDVSSLTVHGNGHCISGGGDSSFFQIESGNVTFEHVTFKQGSSSMKLDGFITEHLYAITVGSGVVLNFENCEFDVNGSDLMLNEGELNITSSDFINNEFGPHGIIHNRGVLNVTSSAFEDNYSNWGPDYPFAAIRNEGKLKMDKCTFLRNLGAIFNEYGEASIRNVTFERNLWRTVINKNGSVEITGGEFKYNRSEKNGGAICNNKGAIVKVTGTVFEDNRAEENGASIYNLGGVKIVSSHFIDHDASNDVILNQNQVQIIESDFTNNKSHSIIANEGQKARLSIEGSVLEDNHCEIQSLLNSGKSCYLTRTRFKNNESEIGPVNNVCNRTRLELHGLKHFIRDGYTIVNYGSVILNKMEDTSRIILNMGDIMEKSLVPTVEFNFSYLDDLIHSTDKTFIFLERDIELDELEAPFFEGGIELDADKLVIDGNNRTITGNFESRIFLVTGRDVTIRNLVFSKGNTYSSVDNIATGGGAIQVNATSSLTLENCVFRENMADEYGGAILNFGNVRLKNVRFFENEAEYGGSIHNYERGFVDVDDCRFHKNSAVKGGAIVNWKRSVVRNTKFIENRSSYTGGAILNMKCFKLDNVEFVGNSSLNSGAINNQAGKLMVDNCKFRQNRSETTGGCISNWAKMDLTGVDFIGNDANFNGGVIGNLERGVVNMDGVKFIDNKTDHNGGAIYNEWIVEAEGCEFQDNFSKLDGGAILSVYHCFLKNSTFKNNHSNKNGGAIATTHEMEIKECTFEYNDAEERGNSIFQGHDFNDISTTRFNLKGNDISYEYFADTSVTDSKFKNNAPKDDEIACDSLISDVKLKDSTFNDESFKSKLDELREKRTRDM